MLSFVAFSQKKVIKKQQLFAKSIEISTIGLDDFVIENSSSNFIEIILIAENSNAQHIVFKEENKTAKIEFRIPEMKSEDLVFKKFITKRLNRANAIIRIPKNKEVIIFGENVNITANDFSSSLEIYIEKGILKLNTILENVKVKLYAGTISANVKKVNTNVESNMGTIKIDQKVQQAHFYKKPINSPFNFSVISVKANIFLTTQ
jgi:hypothetical protein